MASSSISLQTLTLTLPSTLRRRSPPVSSRFHLPSLLGARGLGETSLRTFLSNPPNPPNPNPNPNPPPSPTPTPFPSLSFDKELLGLTGGFPGGEVGLQSFLSKTLKQQKETVISKPEAPELPLLLPGMIVIVKNERNPFHMYCGIVQRVTDGRVGVLFEGGNWDKLISFAIWELERREKGPPMVNPKSAVLEKLVEEK